MTATRIRKNTTPPAAPPPMRRAMRHSRTNRANAGVTLDVSRHRFRCNPEPQLSRAIQSEVAMNGGDEDSAALEMRPHKVAKRGLSAGVERGRRLSAQPRRALGAKEGG